MKQKLIESLPIAGIIAFSGCSVNALAHWLLGWSLNPTPWYWLAAILVEGCTAWLVWSIVDTLRTLTRSRLSKQDRRFYKIVLAAFVALAIPSTTASVVANYVEFQGNPLLACLFPVLTIACAVGAGLPDVVRRYRVQQKADSDAKKAEKAAQLVRQVEDTTANVPHLTNKADRLAWLGGQGENLPDSADLMAAWGVSERTVRRYTQELKEARTNASLDD